jgi:hypothetical protein
MSVNGASRLFTLYHGQCYSYPPTLTHRCTIRWHPRQKWFPQYCDHVLKISIHRASMIIGVALWKMLGLFRDIHQSWNNSLPILAKSVPRTSLPSPETELQQSVSGASSIFGYATYIIQWLYIDIYPQSLFWPSWWAKMRRTILQPPCRNICHWSSNRLCGAQ